VELLDSQTEIMNQSSEIYWVTVSVRLKALMGANKFN